MLADCFFANDVLQITITDTEYIDFTVKTPFDSNFQIKASASPEN
jgi:hypothetical protein